MPPHAALPARPGHPQRGRRPLAFLLALSGVLAGCAEGPLDIDLRPRGEGAPGTTLAARSATAGRPAPDARGIISYPGYQVVVAGRGETVADIARRLDIAPDAMASANAIGADIRLQGGELLVLPGRVDETSAGAGIQTTVLPGAAEVSLAAPAGGTPAQAASRAPAADGEPARHRVERGETAWSIARLYGVNVRVLAEWNGLDSAYQLRQGQILLIPPPEAGPPPAAQAPGRPGTGSTAPPPPSAAQPLPSSAAPAAAARPATSPPRAAATQPAQTPDMGASRTAASGARFAMPAEGRIVRPYEKGRNEAIGIGAAAGSAVRAAADGTVAAITRDTEQVPIIVLRHADNLLTVYANVEGIAVDKDQSVTRGQTIAAVRAGSPAFLHFEVRRGFESVDPMPFLQ
jgi:murein DD-endopeptidase MepM/ murein hydrolase activator NlpD